VIFLEPKRIYNGPFDGHHDRPVVPWSKHPTGEVPEGYYTVPLESAKVFRPGKDVTGDRVRHDGVGVRGRGERDRRRRRDHRPAQPLAARPRHDPRIREEDAALRDRARGDAQHRLSARS
jgi:hypothetical protein